MLIKILIIAMVTIIASSLLRNVKSEFSLIVNICGGIVIFYIIFQNISDLFAELLYIGENSSISPSVITSLIKVIGVGYLTEFCADIAEDSGNKFVASKVILGGKIALCVMAYPIIKNLFISIIRLI